MPLSYQGFFYIVPFVQTNGLLPFGTGRNLNIYLISKVSSSIPKE